MAYYNVVHPAPFILSVVFLAPPKNEKYQKFEDYRFLRSWGLTIIVFGIFSFITDTKLVQIILLSIFLVETNEVSGNLSLFFNILLVIILLVIILHTYRSVKITSIASNRVINTKNIRLGLAMITMYLFSPRLVTLFFFDTWAFIISSFSIRLSEVIGTFIAYLILKNSMKSHNFKEILYLTRVLVLFSIMDLILLISIILFISNVLSIFFFILYSFGITTCFAICYIITGRYSLKKAQEILKS